MRTIPVTLTIRPKTNPLGRVHREVALDTLPIGIATEWQTRVAEGILALAAYERAEGQDARRWDNFCTARDHETRAGFLTRLYNAVMGSSSNHSHIAFEATAMDPEDEAESRRLHDEDEAMIAAEDPCHTPRDFQTPLDEAITSHQAFAQWLQSNKSIRELLHTNSWTVHPYLRYIGLPDHSTTATPRMATTDEAIPF